MELWGPSAFFRHQKVIKNVKIRLSFIHFFPDINLILSFIIWFTLNFLDIIIKLFDLRPKFKVLKSIKQL